MAPLRDKASAVGSVDGWTLDVISIRTSDGAEISVDKPLLMSSSKFWSEMLSSCDTGQVTVDETKESIQLMLQVLTNEPQPSTFDMACKTCWDVYKKVLVVADKYDMPICKERVEKWLVARCLRGKTRCRNFKFQDIRQGQEWLNLCCKYQLKELGWFVAFDLGSQLAISGWELPVTEVLQGIHDPELLRTMLEAVSDTVQAARRPEGAAAGHATIG